MSKKPHFALTQTVTNAYGAPNGPKIKYLSWLHFIWLNDFTRHKYCLSWVNTDTTRSMVQNSVDDTKRGRWHKTRSMMQISVDGTKLGRWHKTRSMTQISVDGTKLGRSHKTRAQNLVDGTKLGRWHKTRSMAQNSVDDTKLGRWRKTPSMAQNSVDGRGRTIDDITLVFQGRVWFKMWEKNFKSEHSWKINNVRGPGGGMFRPVVLFSHLKSYSSLEY